jgi:hypothetical protein
MGRQRWRVWVVATACFAAGAAVAKVGEQWQLGAEQQQRMAGLRKPVAQAMVEISEMQTADRVGPPPTPEQVRALLDRCLASEADCLAFFREHADCIAAQYLWLWARNTTDLVANRALIATLEQVPFDKTDLWPEGDPTVTEQKALARRRIVRRDPGPEQVPLDHENVDLRAGFSNWHEIRW